LLFMGHPPTIQFASLGMADTLILMVLALVVFGPRRLPQIGRQIGKLMYEFRKASNDFKFQMEEELRSAEEADRRKQEEERLRTLAFAPPQPAILPPSPTEPAPALPATTASSDPDEALHTAHTAPIADTSAEETYPRIQPPSTGEQVPASRPAIPTGPLDVQTKSEQNAEKLDAEGGGGFNPRISSRKSAEPLGPEVSPETAPAPEQAPHG
jgi:sec-independent protein translocase protein TatB